MPSSNDESRTEDLPAAAANSSRATATAAAPANESDHYEVAEIEQLLAELDILLDNNGKDFHVFIEIQTTLSKLLQLLGDNTQLITDDRLTRIYQTFNVRPNINVKMGKHLRRLQHLSVSVVYNVIFFVYCLYASNKK
jgi:hypothetical protein